MHAGGVCTEGRSDSTLAGKKCDLSPWTDCSPLRRGSFRADDDMCTPPHPLLLRTCRITRDPRKDCNARCKAMRLMYICLLQAPDQELMRVTGEMCLGSKKKKVKFLRVFLSLTSSPVVQEDKRGDHVRHNLRVVLAGPHHLYPSTPGARVFAEDIRPGVWR